MATILVVDDRPVNRELLTTLLGYAGHRLLEAASGPEGLGLARATKPDLIITDIVMPTMDGYEFARLVRADAALQHTPVVFYTSSYVIAEVRQLADACGVTHIIAKPAEPEDILRTVSLALAEPPQPMAPPPTDSFHEEHMRLLTDKLSAKVDELEAENAERRHAQAQLEDQAARLRVLADASRAFAEAQLDYQAVIDLVAREIVQHLGDNCVVRLLSDDGQWLSLAALHDVDPALAEWARGPQAKPLRVDTLPLVQRVLASAQPLVLPPAAIATLRPAVTPEQLPVLERAAEHSRLVARLRVGGRVIGLLGLGRRRPEWPAFSELDVQLAQDLADRAALAISNARLFTQVQKELAERRQAEEQVQLQSAALTAAANGIVITDNQGTIEWINPAVTAMTGYTLAEAVGKNPRELFKSGAQSPEVYGDLWATILAGDAWQGEVINRRKDGSLYTEEQTITPLKAADGRISHFISVKQDITARKRAEDAVRDSEQRYRLLFELNPMPMWVYDVESLRFLAVNEAAVAHYGYSPAEFKAMTVRDIRPTEEVARLMADLSAPSKRLDRSGHWKHRQKDGTLIDVDIVSHSITFDGHDARLVLASDVTERLKAEALAQRQLDRLAALRSIDLAISGSLDLRVTLEIMLREITSQLQVDAAGVFLINHPAQAIDYAAGRGFRSDAWRQTRLRLGQSYAGQVALERRSLVIPDLDQLPPSTARVAAFEAEGFRAYFGVPLVAKGQVAGVLEVLHRAPLYPEPDWLDFLEALAGQAAIAIDNAALFNDLQRSNQDLSLAYDATIEGWSRALDLRDHETEGHSQRVTDLTLRLAERMGLDQGQLLNLRRGALLHDIGKMGVPDNVLLKPGPLSDEEWVSMRQHPQYAYELLAPIQYLHEALAIPYGHHERWDGTGYPRRLQGQQIPLAARVFAVVDVWDALSSDRPYRRAWPSAQVRDHIRAGAGGHFDPAVVAAFDLMMDEEP